MMHCCVEYCLSSFCILASSNQLRVDERMQSETRTNESTAPTPHVRNFQEDQLCFLDLGWNACGG